VFPWDKLTADDRPLIIVEGLFDAVRAHQEGYKAVATLGGSIKRKQLRIIGEYGTNVVLCPDKDREGLRIAKRNIELLEEYGFSVSLTKPPGAAKDLAEARSLKLEIMPTYVLKFSQKNISQFLGVR
jgi:DNA primase